jgi:hypothetical protein
MDWLGVMSRPALRHHRNSNLIVVKINLTAAL